MVSKNHHENAKNHVEGLHHTHTSYNTQAQKQPQGTVDRNLYLCRKFSKEFLV